MSLKLLDSMGVSLLLASITWYSRLPFSHIQKWTLIGNAMFLNHNSGYRHSIGPWTSTIIVKYVRKKHTQRLALIFGTESTNTKLKSAVTFSDKMSRKIAKMQTHIHTHTPLNSVKGHLVLAVKCYSKESKWQEQEHNQAWPLTRTITSMDRNYFDTE